MLWNKLTLPQKQVCKLLCTGLRTQAIARRLNLPVSTVKGRLYQVYKLAEIPHDKQSNIYLAVKLTYERNPQLIPRDGLRCTTDHGVSTDKTATDKRGYIKPSTRIAGPIFYWTNAPELSTDMQRGTIEPTLECSRDISLSS